ncbi:cellulose binding domain-containing protein [Microbispora sp. ZYX-F-249]|uniref:Cellulose binding domain-containing protein n=1 Tax=Microbispora maris TaxID=3144104 RepID=A0ABV0AZ73_9ACTN
MRFLRGSSRIGAAGLLLAALFTSPAHAAPAEVPDGYGCAVTYTSVGWTTGFYAIVTISNTGTRVFSPWILQFVFPGSQTLTVGWNGTFSATPPSVQVTNPVWRTSIDPGTSFQTGFNANGADEHPSGFTLNGIPCSVTFEPIA